MSVTLAVGNEPVRTRRRAYRLADDFLAFYLGVLSRFRNEIEGGLGPSILPVLVESLDDHLGYPWESAFRAHIVRRAADGDLAERIVAVGPWWAADGSTEIDAVGLAERARTPVLVGEAKWSRDVDGNQIVTGLRRKAERVPGLVPDPVLIVAARERVRGAPQGTHVVTADDIFTP